MRGTGALAALVVCASGCDIVVGVPQVTCSWQQNGSQVSIMGAVNPLPVPGRLVVFVDDVAVDVRYLFVVTRS